MRVFVRSVVAGVVAAGVVALAGCGGAAQPTGATDASGKPLTHVVLALAADVIGTGQASYTSVPMALDYWKDEGLDVELLGLKGGSAAIQAVASGQAQVAQGGPAPILAANEQGADMITFFSQITKNVYIPQVPEDSDIKEVADFAGKKVGVPSLDSAAVPLFQGLLQDEGVDPNSVQLIAIGTGAEALAALQGHQVDAIQAYDTIYADIEAAGFPLRPVSTPDFDAIGWGNTLSAPKDWLAQNQDIAIGLARGWAKATLFTMENPEATVRIHWDQYPASKPTGVSEQDALDQAVRSIQIRSKSTQPIDGVWGLATDAAVQANIAAALSSGAISTAPAVSDVWTPDLLDAINDFDQDAVRAQAADWTAP